MHLTFKTSLFDYRWGATLREVFKKNWYKASNCDSITDDLASAIALDDANAFAEATLDTANADAALLATVTPLEHWYTTWADLVTIPNSPNIRHGPFNPLSPLFVEHAIKKTFSLSKNEPADDDTTGDWPSSLTTAIASDATKEDGFKQTWAK